MKFRFLLPIALSVSSAFTLPKTQAPKNTRYDLIARAPRVGTVNTDHGTSEPKPIVGEPSVQVLHFGIDEYNNEDFSTLMSGKGPVFLLNPKDQPTRLFGGHVDASELDKTYYSLQKHTGIKVSESGMVVKRRLGQENPETASNFVDANRRSGSSDSSTPRTYRRGRIRRASSSSSGTELKSRAQQLWNKIKNVLRAVGPSLVANQKKAQTDTRIYYNTAHGSVSNFKSNHESMTYIGKPDEQLGLQFDMAGNIIADGDSLGFYQEASPVDTKAYPAVTPSDDGDEHLVPTVGKLSMAETMEIRDKADAWMQWETFPESRAQRDIVSPTIVERGTIQQISSVTAPETSAASTTSTDKTSYENCLSAFQYAQANASNIVTPFILDMLNGTNSSMMYEAAWSIYSELTAATEQVIGPFTMGLNSIDWMEDQLFNGTAYTIDMLMAKSNLTHHELALLETVVVLEGVYEVYEKTWDAAYYALSSTGLLADMVKLAGWLMPNDTSIIPATRMHVIPDASAGNVKFFTQYLQSNTS